MNITLLWPFARGAKFGKPRKDDDEEEEVAKLEELGVTPQLLDFVKDFTLDTFRNFPLKDDPTADGDVDTSSGSSLSKDLSDWQERHAMLLLGKAKEISQIRYALCPRFLKDKQFWRIYFLLVKNYVSPYEKRAIQNANTKKNLEKANSYDKVAIEVEMTESKPACCSEAHADRSGGEGTAGE